MRLAIKESRWPLGTVVAGAAALATLAVRVLHLDRLPFGLCAFRAITGVPCLSCGATRALGRLADLDVPGAWTLHPGVTVTALGLMVWGVVDLALLPRRRRLSLRLSRREGTWLAWIGVAVWLASWAYLIAVGR